MLICIVWLNVQKLEKNSYTNSFTATYVHSLYDAGLLFKATSNEDVSTANKEEGKKKRRIKYLKSKIQELIKELNTLEGN